MKNSKIDLMKKILKNINKWSKNKDNSKNLEILRKRKLNTNKESHLKLENKKNSRIIIKKVIMDSKNLRN